MHRVSKTTIVLLLTALSITGCSSTPEQQVDPFNEEGSQRSRSQQAQDELSAETDKNK